MKDKTYQSYVNYFKKWEGCATLGIILAAIGFLMLWLGLSFFSYILAVVLMPGGLALFLYGSIGRANESDLQSIAERKKASLVFPEIEETDLARYNHRAVEKFEELVFEGFVLRDGLMVKTQKNGTACSSEYAIAKMRIYADRLWIRGLTFSFIEDSEAHFEHTVALTDLKDAVVERDRKTVTGSNKRRVLGKFCDLVLTLTDGTELRFLAKDDIYTDEFAQGLLRRRNTK